MANYNFEIWDEDPRVLFVTDSISLEEKDLIEQSVMDLQNACQDYALFADEETYEMYEETIFNMAGVLAEVLGCGIITHDSYDVYTWYASDAVYPDGNVLPIVWNVGQDVYAVEVGGISLKRNLMFHFGNGINQTVHGRQAETRHIGHIKL